MQPMMLPSGSSDTVRQPAGSVDETSPQAETKRDPSVAWNESVPASEEDVDLPVKSCLTLLHTNLSTMAEQYKTYLHTKKARTEDDPLTFRQYVFVSSIRLVPDFVFKQTKLAYYMMRSQGSHLVQREAFIRYAPVLEIASKHDADRIYEALQAGRGGIHFEEFTEYVEALFREKQAVTRAWPGFPEAYGFEKEELLLTRARFADHTEFLPSVGRLAICRSHVMFESIMGKHRIWHYDYVDHVESSNEGMSGKDPQLNKGMKVYMKEGQAHEKESKEAVMIWSVPGTGPDSMVEGARTECYLRDMSLAHHCRSKLKKKAVATAVIAETAATVRRMKALEAVGRVSDPLILSPFRSSATKPEDSPFVVSVRNEFKRVQRIRKNRMPWLYKVLPGMQSSESKSALIADIDPETRLFEARKEPKDKHEEPVGVGTLTKHVRNFSHHVEPLLLMMTFIKKLRDWEKPVVTLPTVLFLLNLAYWDCLAYLPAILVFINALVILLLRYRPKILSSWLNKFVDENDTSMKRTCGHPEGSPDQTDRSTPSPSDDGATADPGKLDAVATHPTEKTVSKESKGKEDGFFSRVTSSVRKYTKAASTAYAGAQKLQNVLSDINCRLSQIEGLYTWRRSEPSHKFLLASVGGFLALLFIPFRFLFTFIVLHFFTQKFQREGSLFTHLLDEVPSPCDNFIVD